jgi:hypothetical protein
LKHHATAAFWQAYESLPAHVQELADRNFEKLKSDSKHHLYISSKPVASGLSGLVRHGARSPCVTAITSSGFGSVRTHSMTSY